MEKREMSAFLCLLKDKNNPQKSMEVHFPQKTETQACHRFYFQWKYYCGGKILIYSSQGCIVFLTPILLRGKISSISLCTILVIHFQYLTTTH